MAAEDEHVALLREGYRNWAASKARSVDHWLDLVDEEIRLRSLADGAPGLEFTSPRSGKQALRAYLEGIAAGWEMLSYEVTDYVAQGDRVVAIVDSAWRNRQTGKTIELPKVDIWRFRDGRAVEFLEFYDTARLIACAQA